MVMIPEDKFDEAKQKEAMSIYIKNLYGKGEQQSETAPHRLVGEEQFRFVVLPFHKDS